MQLSTKNANNINVNNYRFVLTNLARFHAATHAFIEKECGGSDKFKEDWELVCTEAFLGDNNPMMEPMFDNGANSCINILKVI